MKTFKKFVLLESIKPVVSFDFDGTLHASVKTDRNGDIHPFPFFGPAERYQPLTNMINLLRKEAETNTVIIITKRGEESVELVKKFVEMHNLPVSNFYFTDENSKLPYLKKNGSHTAL